MKDLKKYLGLIPIALFAFMLGCGGGGGSSDGGNGSTNSTTGFTAGNTTAQAGDTILGQLVRFTTPIPNATVRFYTSGNVLLGTDVTNADGYFSASLGANATRMDVQSGTFSGTIGFNYGSGIYQASTGSLDCKVPLPTITPGVLTLMPNGQFVFPHPSSPPLPPPTGCLP